VQRTIRWAKECREQPRADGQIVFGIVQGGVDAGLRERCAKELTAMEFDGYAIGGVSVGEPEHEMMKAVELTEPFLPARQPRYAMGLGTPAQLVELVARGVDMFDCVLPTRVARNGLAFTPDGPINLRNERFRADPRPLVEGLDNYTCRHFSRAYLRHLMLAGEMLGGTLLTLHNLHFFLDLTAQARAHIAAGDYGPWHRAWIERYEAATA
jgi:queuine tRNA-ribosyltransferase